MCSGTTVTFGSWEPAVQLISPDTVLVVTYWRQWLANVQA
jgi:hypothetical protein